MQVSSRSPRPERPATVSARPPRAATRRRELGEAAGDEGGAGVLAEAGADHGAGGDGDDVLGGAAELGADRVVVAVEAEGGAGEQAMRRARRAGSVAATTEAAGSPAATSCGEVGTGQDRGRRRRVQPGEDLERERERVALDALGADDHRARAGRSGRDGAQMLDGHGEQERRRSRSRGGRR